MNHLIVLSWIGDIFLDLISRALYGLSSLFCSIVYAIEKVYFFLLGVEDIPQSDNKNIFEQIFDNNETFRILGIFLLVAGFFWIISFIVSLIKSMVNQDTPGATKKALFNSGKSIIGIVVMPFLCFTFFLLAVQLITVIVHQLNGGENSSLATHIWETGYKNFEIQDSGVAVYPFTSSYDTSMGYQFSSQNISGLTGFFNIGKDYHFDYFIVLIGAVALGVCMAIATIKLCGRLINLTILFIISPVVVSTMSVDDGKRYEAWKEVSISKLFSIMGSVLAMYIYLILLQVVSTASLSIMNQPAQEGWEYVLNAITGIFFFLICAIAGALIVIKGSDMLESIISQNAGGQDGLSAIAMGHVGRVLGRGLRGLGSKGKQALFGKSGNGNGGSGGNGNGGSGGNGAFQNKGSTGAWGSLKNAMSKNPVSQGLSSLKNNGLVGSLVNAGASMKDTALANKQMKEVGFKHPSLHPSLRNEQKRNIQKDRQQLENLKRQGANKQEINQLKQAGLGTTEFRTKAIELGQKYKKQAEEGVYR